MTKALLLLSEGAEEIETVVSADVLTRGSVQVTIAALDSKECVTCSRNVVIKPDALLADVKSQEFDVVILPGGLKGSQNLSKSELVGDLLRKQEKNGKLIACICAAPTALAAHKIAAGKTVTSYPSFQNELQSAGYKYSDEKVVIDGSLITSRGPATSFDFALAILEKLKGSEVKKSVADGMLYK